MLDKIFATGSSIAFVHTRCYSQYKMKVPRSDIRKTHVGKLNSPTTDAVNYLINLF